MSQSVPAKTAGKAKKEKPALSVGEQVSTLYRSLHSQLEGGFNANALRTCDKILRLTPTDTLAAHTKTQLLIALDQYAAALQQLETKDTQSDLDKVYCLYKSGRIAEAEEALGELEDVDAREVRLLEAQIKYRLGDYSASRDIYEDLIATAEDDSPELVDLQTNLDACSARLEFIASVPSHLSHTPVETLESTPIGPLIHSNPLFKSAPVNVSSLAAASALPTKKARATPRRLPKKYDASKAPDPDRWLPKRERPGFAEEIVRKREMERGKKKQALMTQGAAKPAKAAAATSGAGGGGGSTSKKKKKGKK